MRKTKFIPILLIFSILFFSISVNAFGIIQENFETFIKHLNNGDEEIYNYIDTSNIQLTDDIKENLKKMKVEYSNINISSLKTEGINIKCKMKVFIDGNIRKEGTFNFKIEEINSNKYIISSTNLFNNDLAISKPSIIKSNEETPQKSFSNFISYLNNGDNRVYSYIDNSNIELATNIDKYIDSIEINYYNFEIEEFGNDKYIIECQINAEGEGWSTSGFKSEYYLRKQDNRYIIYETTLFDIVGVENMSKFITSIFIIIGIFSLLFPFIIIIIIFKVIKKIKKETDNNLDSISYEEKIDIDSENNSQFGNSIDNDNPIQYK